VCDPNTTCGTYQGGHYDWKEHSHGPKGPGFKVSESGAHNVQQPPHFQAPHDIFRYTTEKLLSLAAQYTTSKEVAGPPPVLGGREAAPSSTKVTPSSIAIQGTNKDVKGGKKRRKWFP
jgi:hypothetical protein